MRLTALACLLFACAPPRAPAPAPASAPAPAPASAPLTERLVYATPIHDPSITSADAIDPTEARRVQTVLFRRHLPDLRHCPTPFFVPTGWVDVDNLQDQNFAAGRFVSVVEQRIEGSFTGPDEHEVLFVIRIDNCQSNTFPHYEFAIFPTTLAKPRLRWTDRALNDSRIVAVVRDEHRPVQFVLADSHNGGGRLVELNRPFVPGAPLRDSTESSTLDGGPVVEPWSVIATWHMEHSLECRRVYVSLEAPHTLRSEITPGRCP